ncbi:MAG: hypothetical protein N2114_03930 [Candidatus Goldbacteria bacterium]|nr:hypothetical protein [Candidatus Goldiibacteriota bacterium]
MKIIKIVRIIVMMIFMISLLGGCSLHYLMEEEKAEKMEKARRLVSMGDTAYANKYYERALIFYDNALSLYEHSFIYKKIANTLKKMGKDKEALMVYQYSIKLQKKEEGGEKR